MAVKVGNRLFLACQRGRFHRWPLILKIRIRSTPARLAASSKLRLSVTEFPNKLAAYSRLTATNVKPPRFPQAAPAASSTASSSPQSWNSSLRLCHVHGVLNAKLLVHHRLFCAQAKREESH